MDVNHHLFCGNFLIMEAHMRTSREVAAASRARIVQTAALLFRKGGMEATSIADVMLAAGMTHGGFYKHFPSKEGLEAEAVRSAFADLRARFDKYGVSGDNGCAKVAYTNSYLSAQHVSHPDKGCPVAALGPESGRSGQAVKAEFTAGIGDIIDRFAAVDGKADDLQNRSDAILQLALMVGSVVIARSCGDAKLSEEVLSAARGKLL
jgi:TetR/AcrR family transcriptional regulator, transcriptional repressor for nem operon